MSTDRFTACLAFTLREEGTWSENPDDPGGCTNQGVTLATLSEYLGYQCTPLHLRQMTPAVRDRLYHDLYWLKVSADKLAPGLDLMVFDFGVNAGPETSVILLQATVGATEDGVIGPHTLAEIARVPVHTLIGMLAFHQLGHYRALAGWPTFGAGWEARNGRAKMAALAAAAQVANVA